MTHITRLVAASGRGAAFSYRYQTIHGKRRYLAVPNKRMKAVHRSLIHRLRRVPNLATILENSYGALGRRSVVDNAMAHVGNRYFYQLDIKDAYPNTPVLWILAYTLNLVDPSLGEVEEIQQFLDTYCIAKKDGMPAGLATGAPASPALFDLYCGVAIDEKIRELCHSCVYTRYLDDLTISSEQPIPARLRRKIRDIIREAGYEVHRHKSALKDRARSAVTITGVVITRKNRLRPTMAFAEKVDEVLAAMSTEADRANVPLLRGLNGHLLSFRNTPASMMTYDLRSRVDIALWQARELEPVRRKRSKIYSARELDAIRANAPFVEIVQSYVRGLKRTGDEYKACCPYHHEKTPSFTLNVEKAFYHCFGCGAHGDVFRFVMDFTKCSFPAAIRYVRRYKPATNSKTPST